MEESLAKINAAGAKLLTLEGQEATYKSIIREVSKIVGGKYGSVILSHNDKLERVYATDDFLYDIRIKEGGISYKVFQNKIPTTIVVDQTKKIFNAEIIKRRIKTIIFIPLFYRKKSFGILTIHCIKKKELTTHDKELLTLLSSIASLVIRQNQLYEETREALETRDLFISLASHELRTPLTSINGYIQLLHAKLGHDNSKESGWIRELHTESTRLTNLVKELLEINRIKQGQLHYALRECSFTAIIKKAITRAVFANSKRQINFKTSLIKDDVLLADSDKLLQMLGSLIQNAIKFSNGEIGVCLSEEKNMLVLEIKDKGEGIKDQDLPHIFEEFYKGENSRKKEKKGLGVGLLLARHIIKYHKGDIAILSSEKQGTRVTIRLPKKSFIEPNL